MSKEKPQTKVCKHCRTEIPYEARVCPQCRKKQKGGILKWVLIIVVALVVVGFAAGWSEDEEKVANIQPENNTEKESESETKTETEQDIEEKETGKKEKEVKEEDVGVEILAEYTLSDGINWYTRHFMIVKNNSPETLDVSTSSLAYAEDGTMVSAADSSLEALGAGCTSIMYEAFETDEKINRYETELKTEPSEYYKSVIQDLSVKQNDIKDGAVFQVTNNGEEAAEFVEGYALFFSNGNLVNFESAYFTDDDSKIDPGKTISQQMTSHEDFDKIEFYLTGRR